MLVSTDKTENEEIRRVIDVIAENGDAANMVVCGIHTAFLKENQDAYDGFLALMTQIDPSRPREKIVACNLMETFIDAAKDYTPTAQKWVSDVVVATQKSHPILFDESLQKAADELLLRLK